MSESNGSGDDDVAEISHQKWITEALERLIAELECTRGHWQNAIDNPDQDSAECQTSLLAVGQHLEVMPSHIVDTMVAVMQTMSAATIAEMTRHRMEQYLGQEVEVNTMTVTDNNGNKVGSGYAFKVKDTGESVDDLISKVLGRDV